VAAKINIVRRVCADGSERSYVTVLDSRTSKVIESLGPDPSPAQIRRAVREHGVHIRISKETSSAE